MMLFYVSAFLALCARIQSVHASDTQAFFNRGPNINDSDVESLVAVMGATGSGKTTFINLASGSDLRVGSGLMSCTSDVQTSKPFRLGDRTVRLIDTPGFDDTTRSDTDVLSMISAYLSTTYTDVPFDIGEAREQELKEQDIFFKPVLDEGAQIKRHNNTLASTQEILRSVAFKGTVPLRIQKELVDEKKDITDTDAGEELGRELHEQAVKFKEQQEKLREEMEEALKNNDEKARVELEKATAKLNEDINRLTSDSARMASSFADAQRRMQQELAEARSSRGGFFSHLGRALDSLF
ncbi:P-loop containing nucleoside triphosphate hydrolase [Pleurotus pulmonarius]